jgi:hypothetical protein
VTANRRDPVPRTDNPTKQTREKNLMWIYGIIDKLAHDVTGTLVTFKTDAQAVRFFRDVALDKNTMVSRHIEDYEIVCYGQLFPYDIQPHTPAKFVYGGEQLATELRARAEEDTK